jgi:hypothetical protein
MYVKGTGWMIAHCALLVLQPYYKLSGEATEVCPGGMVVKALGHKAMAPSKSSFKSPSCKYRSYVRTSRGWVLVCDSASPREATASAWTATPLCASLELRSDLSTLVSSPYADGRALDAGAAASSFRQPEAVSFSMPTRVGSSYSSFTRRCIASSGCAFACYPRHILVGALYATSPHPTSQEL